VVARTPTQRYKAYYLLAYNAKKLCFNGLAAQGYQQALKLAPDSSSKYKALNSLASVYFYAQQSRQARAMNQRSIAYFERQLQRPRLSAAQRQAAGTSLSYAYELKGLILKQQGEYAALTALRQTIKLRQQHAPTQLGFAYEQMAGAFAHFNLPDSAIAYQRQAVASYPISSPNQSATQRILLAKYQLFAQRPEAALPHLQATQKLAKRLLTKILWSHTFSLYLAQTNDKERARQSFGICDSLLLKALADAPDATTRKTISEQALALYKDAQKIQVLQAKEQSNNQQRRNLMQVVLTGANRELKAREAVYSQDMAFANYYPANNKQNAWVYIGFGISIALALFALGWAVRVQHRARQQQLKRWQKQVLAEHEMVKKIEQACQLELGFVESGVVKLLCQNKSYGEIGGAMAMNPGTLKSKVNRLAKRAGNYSMRELITAIRQKEYPPEKKLEK
jgi:hypothetical protein